MSTSRDHRLAQHATAIRPGDTVRVTITKGRQSERGTFETVTREHAEVPGLLIADLHDREIVVQRPNGDQPYAVEAA